MEIKNGATADSGRRFLLTVRETRGNETLLGFVGSAVLTAHEYGSDHNSHTAHKQAAGNDEQHAAVTGVWQK